MAVPPSSILTRRLIKKFFKKYKVQNQSQMRTNPLQELARCWDKIGHDHPDCYSYLINYEQYLKDTKDFDNKIKELGLPEMVNNQLRRPSYKHQKKGKFKDVLSGPKRKHNNFFDGVE